MKVRELIERLRRIDPERVVVVQKDAEGNNFSPLSEVYRAAYLAEPGEELPDGYDEEDVLVLALVLRPVN